MRSPIVIFHIASAFLRLASGAIAMIFRKGSTGHRWAGNVFVFSLALMVFVGFGLLQCAPASNTIISHSCP